MSSIRFWNGNKSAVRQTFELTLLQRALNVCGTAHSKCTIAEDRSDYPDAADEGDIFNKSIDVCVTVAGNPKFKPGDFLPVYDPLMYGLLGHRLLIIREEDAESFADIHRAMQLREKSIGIPETWADNRLFRDNGFSVVERGSFDEIFVRLKKREFDFVSLGANEVHAVFSEKAKALGGLMIEPTLRIYYPYALIFYVHPSQHDLAFSLSQGLSILRRSGEYEKLFRDFFSEMFKQAKLAERKEIPLANLALPIELKQVMDYTAATLNRTFIQPT